MAYVGMFHIYKILPKLRLLFVGFYMAAFKEMEDYETWDTANVYVIV